MEIGAVFASHEWIETDRLGLRQAPARPVDLHTTSGMSQPHVTGLYSRAADNPILFNGEGVLNVEEASEVARSV
ncbi:hypothetical protein GCM10009641_15540 [Mycobacterium cookii]|uniref:Uncharacterized protein n=1 Tax=Mycobacterium cookii TaxID=1775 RepID=A0A7I7L002_9MYCO|nr:hypothetical protein MCOO_33710 [Mycobacterium cookii]